MKKARAFYIPLYVAKRYELFNLTKRGNRKYTIKLT